MTNNHRGTPLKTIIVIVVLPLFAYLYANSVKTVDTLRTGCERTNVTRTEFGGLLTDLVQANKRRIEAPTATPAEDDANRAALQKYRDRRTSLQESVEPLEEGTKWEVDCEAAYPKPWPLS